LSFATINDLFFLHERGTQAGVQGMWLTFGSSMAPVICGYLIQAAGWRWYHWLVTILAGIDVVLIFLFFPETQYPRNLHTSMDITHAIDDASFQSDEPEQEKVKTSRTVSTINSSPAYPKKKTFIQELKPWSPVDPDVSLVGAFIRPWLVWAFPSMIWGVLAFSLNVAWQVTPPHNLSGI
jgi:MFS family permease